MSNYPYRVPAWLQPPPPDPWNEAERVPAWLRGYNFYSDPMQPQGRSLRNPQVQGNYPGQSAGLNELEGLSYALNQAPAWLRMLPKFTQQPAPQSIPWDPRISSNVPMSQTVGRPQVEPYTGQMPAGAIPWDPRISSNVPLDHTIGRPQVEPYKIQPVQQSIPSRAVPTSRPRPTPTRVRPTRHVK